MPVRRAQLSDAAAIRSIWQDNVAAVRAFWPDGPQTVPDWDLALAQRMVQLVIDDKAECGVFTNAGVVTTMLYVFKGRRVRWSAEEDVDEAIIWLVKLSDLTGTVNQRATKARNRFNNEMPQLIEAWGRDAQTRAVSRCAGRYPTTGNQTAINMLNTMTSRNGIAPDTTTMPGWLCFAVTPDELIIGAGGVP